VAIIRGIYNIKTGPWQFAHTVHTMTLEEFYKCVPFEILVIFLLTYSRKQSPS